MIEQNINLILINQTLNIGILASDIVGQSFVLIGGFIVSVLILIIGIVIIIFLIFKLINTILTKKQFSYLYITYSTFIMCIITILIVGYSWMMGDVESKTLEHIYFFCLLIGFINFIIHILLMKKGEL
jgi:uncharacterized protein YebE (UPF0316 family)